MSGIIHKVKDAIAEHKEEKAEQKAEQTGTTHNSHQSSNYGPHDSNVANAADPRVDSDRSKYNTSSTTGPTSTGAGLTGASHSNYDSGRSSNYGPHDSKIANTADPRVDSDRSHSAYNTTSTGPTSTLASGTGHTTNYDSGRSSNYGPHGSNIANAADPRVDSDLSNSHRSGAGMTGAGMTGAGMTGAGMTGAGHNTYDSSRSSNFGPHDSKMANAADPRVDSDRSAYNTTGHHSGAGMTGAGMTGAGMTGAGMTGAGMTGAAHAHNSGRSSNYGPHDSNIANTADPRVDSDLSNRHGGSGYNTSSTGHHSNAGMAGAGLAGAGVAGAGMAGAHHHNTHNTHDSSRSSNYGPHDSNIANTADPRVDSDLSNRHGSSGYNTSSTGHHSNAGMTGAGLAGAGATGAGMAGAHHHNTHNTHRSSNNGPHDSNIANTADPRVDSDLSNRHGSTGVPSTHSYATGPASSTAGPHESNLANKVDPRVDSDLSKQKTHHSSMSSGMHTGGSPDTTTRSFEEAQKTAGVNPHISSDSAGAGSSYNHHGSVGTSATAGPHNSSIGNKMDPRVDSDLDNSASIGHQRV